MLNRIVSLAVTASVVSIAAFGACTPATTSRFVLQFPPSSAAPNTFQAFSADDNCSGPVVNATAAPTGVSQLAAKPDGSKFYVLGTGGVQSMDPSFTSVRPITGITGTPTSMTISPDGRYLYVAAGGLYIVDTTSDSLLSNGVPITGTVIGTVFNATSTLAYVLTDSVLGSAVSQINTATRLRVGAALNLPFGCGVDSLGRSNCTVTMSPTQLLYVTNGYFIFEIDPVAMALTPNGQISTNISTLGQLRFTSDGTVGFAVNRTPNIGGRVLLKFTPATHSVVEWYPFTNGSITPAFVDVFPASPTRVFAVSGIDTTLWDVTVSPLSAGPSTSIPALGVAVTNTVSAALSNEQPSARYLYLLVANGNQYNFQKVDLATNAVVSNLFAPLGPGTLQFLPVPPQTGAASFVQFNNNQTIQPGGTSAPLGAVITNNPGWPLYNIPVTYSVDPSSGIVISSASTSTNANGYVQAVAAMPQTPGVYAVTLTAGSATATYNLTVPGSTGAGGGGGGGGGGATSQISIVGGNGMLVYSFQPNFLSPLTVKLVDQNGNPLQNAVVNFTVVSGPGQVNPPAAVTDQNGLAAVLFTPQVPQLGQTFGSTDINASSSVGAVDFIETTYQLNPDGTGQPQISLLTPGPAANYTINAGAGDLVSGAIAASIYASIPPIGGIPNVGIRIGSGSDPTQPGPASCVGNNLSDNTGVASCNLQVGCQLGSTGLSVVIGEIRTFTAFLNVGPGTTQTLTKLSGDNQTGQGGQTLPQSLTARITDNCGNAISKAQATWRVTQGSATLTSTTSISDSGGNIATRVVLGQTPGTVQVTATLASGAKVVFNATVNVTVGGLTLVSGNNQTALTNQGFAQPLIFAVTDNNGKPLAGIQVNFSVSSGSANLSTSSATTNSSGQVSVSVTAGSNAGKVVILASASTFTATANLAVNLPGPVITTSSFANYASGKQGLTTCGLGTATGPGVAPTVSGIVLGNPLGLAGPLPYTIVTTSMTINGIPVPLLYLSNQNGTQQVAFQTPCETLAGAATVAMTVGGATTTVTGVQVNTALPGIFTYAGPNGKTYGEVIRGLDGSYVTPSNLARRGETYYLVATGLGQTTPPAITNATGAGQTIPTSQVVVGVNNAGMPVVSVQYVAIGVYYVGFQIPLNAPQGNDQPLSLGSVQGSQTVYDNQGALLPGVQ